MKKRAINLVILTTLLVGGQAVNIIPSTAVVAEAAQTKIGTVTADVLNVRAKASTSSSKLGKLTMGQKVTIVSTSGGWHRIKYGSGYGYVSAQYISTGSPKPVDQGKKADQVINLASTLVGIPYKSGGTTTNGFDCSGFTQYVFSKCGIALGRTTKDQVKNGTGVSRISDLKKGDLILFKDTYNNCTNPSHVGIYAGNNEFYHASSSRGVIKVSLNSIARNDNHKTWKDLFYTGRRVIK